MRKSLFIRINDRDASCAEWMALNASGEADAPVAAGTWAQAAEAAEGRRVVLLVPATQLLLTDVDIPTRNRQHLAKALPYALEDVVTEEVDELHFAAGVRKGQERLPVAVVAKAHMERWLQLAQEAGLRPEALLPEVLALPWTPGEWTAAVDEHGALVRTGEQAGFACDSGNLTTLLRLALEQAGEQRPSRLQLLHCSPMAADALAELNVEVTLTQCPAGLLPVLAQAAAGQSETINLLQGSYSLREQYSKLWRPWRPAAVILAVLLFVHLVTMAVGYTRLRHESRELAAQIERLYRQTFPDDKRVVNARAQMEQHLKTLRGEIGRGGGGLLTLLAQSGSALKNPAILKLDGLNYRNGQLDVELTIKDLQSLDQIKQDLSSKGLKVDIRSASARDGNVSSRLRISGENS